MKDELNKAKSLKEIFAVCEKYYDLDKPLGIATKAIVQKGVFHVITLIKAKEKF